MKRKIIGICVMMLLIGTAVLPVTGIMNKENDIYILSKSGPNIEWEKTFGGNDFDWFYSVQQTNDKGYIILGGSEDSDMNSAWLMKVDPDGNEEWSSINFEITGANEYETVMSCVRQTSDGGYLAGGYGKYYVEYSEIWYVFGCLWKVDSYGNTEWIKWIGNEEESWTLYPMVFEEVDDGFICGGTYVKGTPSNYFMDVMLMKTDKYGNLEWYQSYDLGGNYEWVRSLDFTLDSGYFITGFTQEIFLQGGAFIMIKTDNEGNKQWDKIFDGAGFEYSNTMGCRQANDGGYIMSGNTGSYGFGGTDLWIIKTDSSGNEEWNKTFGSPNNDRCYSMDATVDGGYVFVVINNIEGIIGTKEDLRIIKIDDNGNAEWNFIREEGGTQHLSSIAQTEDGGFIVAGRTGKMDRKSSDGLIMKLSSFENQRPSNPSTPTGPSQGKSDIEYTFLTTAVTDPDGDMVYYRWDWGDGNYSELLDTPEATYSWSYEDNFEIRVMAVDEEGGESYWSDSLPFSTPKNKSLNAFNLWIIRLIQRFPNLEFLILST